MNIFAYQEKIVSKTIFEQIKNDEFVHKVESLGDSAKYPGLTWYIAILKNELEVTFYYDEKNNHDLNVYADKEVLEEINKIDVFTDEEILEEIRRYADKIKGLLKLILKK